MRNVLDEGTAQWLSAPWPAICRKHASFARCTRSLADYPLRQGRSLRASFCIAAARAFGATVSDAVRSAVSLELLHNAFLVHDDIEDEKRRATRPARVASSSRCSVSAERWRRAAGLGTTSPARRNRSALGPRIAWRIIEETERIVRRIRRKGQAMELRWRRDNDAALTECDYLTMTLKKTCWYTTIFPCRVGALIGTRDAADLDQFVRFGFLLWAPRFRFRMTCSIWSGTTRNTARNSRAIFAKASARSCSYTFFNMLVRPIGRGCRVCLALPRAEKSEQEISWLRGAMRRLDCVEYARSVAHALAGAALHEFRVAFGSAVECRDKGFH